MQPFYFRRALIFAVLWTVLLAYFFANVEVQIEGAAGWAGNLPTWRVEHHWLLDIFWGGRAMTGYHAWVFPFIALFFHFPMALQASWSWRAEARVFGCIMLFWMLEDFLWFVINPAFGLARFGPAWIPWHKHWWGPVPSDYWVFAIIAALMFYASCWRAGARVDQSAR